MQKHIILQELGMLLALFSAVFVGMLSITVGAVRAPIALQPLYTHSLPSLAHNGLFAAEANSYPALLPSQSSSLDSSDATASILPSSTNSASNPSSAIQRSIASASTAPQEISSDPSSSSSGSVSQAPVCDSGWASTLLDLLNQYRLDNGLGALQMSPGLLQAACLQSTYMSSQQTLSHEGENGSSVWERCARFGVQCDAENVVMASPTLSPQKALELWKASPGHNANMLGVHTQVGIAEVGGYAATVFW